MSEYREEVVIPLRRFAVAGRVTFALHEDVVSVSGMISHNIRPVGREGAFDMKFVATIVKGFPDRPYNVMFTKTIAQFQLSLSLHMEVREGASPKSRPVS